MLDYKSQTLNRIISVQGYDGNVFTVSPDRLIKLKETIKSIYEQNEIAVTEPLVDAISIALIRQTHSDRDNPFVEHEETHGIRVAKNTMMAYRFFKNYYPTDIERSKQTLGLLSDDTYKFILITMGLLHDCNYFVNHDANEIKTIHSLKSALIAYQAVDKTMKTILRSHELDTTRIEKTMHNFYDAILCHNGDKQEAHFPHLLDSPIGQIPYVHYNLLEALLNHCLEHDVSHAFISLCTTNDTPTIGRPCHKHDSYGIRNQDATIENNLLLFLLRLSDDFDSTQDRLLPHQKTALQQLLSHAKHYMKTRFDHLNQCPVGQWPWGHILNDGKKHGTLHFNEQEQQFIDKVIEKKTEGPESGHSTSDDYNVQMRYYIGLWLVKSITLTNPSGILTINVSINQGTGVTGLLIDFYSSMVSILDKDPENPTKVLCKEFYGRRIHRKGMGLEFS